jgi:hypothetical protein
MPISLSNELLLILVFVQVLLATAMVALIWCVQIVLYPQFRDIGEPYWRRYHQIYMRRFACLVVPIMLLEIALAGFGLLVLGDRTLPIVGFLLVGALWGSTGLIQVPLHRGLSVAFSPDIHRKLVVTNWIRTVLWTVRWVFLIWWLIHLRTAT